MGDSALSGIHSCTASALPALSAPVSNVTRICVLGSRIARGWFGVQGGGVTQIHPGDDGIAVTAVGWRFHESNATCMHFFAREACVSSVGAIMESAGVSPASIRPVPNPLWREPVERKLPTEPPTNLGHHPTNQHIPQSPPIPKITVQTTPFAPLSVLRGQSPSFQPPTRHSGDGRNPEGRGGGTSHQSQKSQFRQPPSRPSWIIPVIPTAHPSFRRRPESRGARRRGHPTNHKNHTNHSSDNSLRALSVLRGQSPSFQPPTRHSGGGRNPRGARRRGESH